jgi:hypothetical protein
MKRKINSNNLNNISKILIFNQIPRIHKLKILILLQKIVTIIVNHKKHLNYKIKTQKHLK